MCPGQLRFFETNTCNYLLYERVKGRPNRPVERTSSRTEQDDDVDESFALDVVEINTCHVLLWKGQFVPCRKGQFEPYT